MPSPTFKTVFEQWYGRYDRTVETKTSRSTYQAISDHVLPIIGDIEVDKLKPKQVLDLSDQIAQHSTYYARRLAADIIRILDYAVVIMQVVDFNYVARITAFLCEHHVIGRRYVSFDELPAMLRDIDTKCTSHPNIMTAFWFMVYTGVRRSEAALAKKSEFDLEAMIWTIPAERMKVRANGQHKVMLSVQCIEMLEPLFSNNSDYLFVSPTKRKQAINPSSINYIMHQSGWGHKQHPHGFRSIFSTHAHLSNKWSVDAIELSLAHRITGVRGVYNHAQYLDERAELMQWYADEVDKWRGIS